MDAEQQTGTAEDIRRARIMEGAAKMFLAYGFQRTTMDDIARAVDLSRPALYLVFRNKTEIYRAIASAMFADTQALAEREFAREGSFGERLMRAVETSIMAVMRQFQEAPHGSEILDMKNSLAGDIAAEWRERFSALITREIEAEAARRGVDLQARGVSADAMAALFLDGLEGMKARETDPRALTRGTRQLVRMMELALQP